MPGKVPLSRGLDGLVPSVDPWILCSHPLFIVCLLCVVLQSHLVSDALSLYL